MLAHLKVIEVRQLQLFMYSTQFRDFCLKLKFLCERFSHCIYSFCSIELNNSWNTWSLTAVDIQVICIRNLSYLRYLRCISWNRKIQYMKIPSEFKQIIIEYMKLIHYDNFPKQWLWKSVEHLGTLILFMWTGIYRQNGRFWVFNSKK